MSPFVCLSLALSFFCSLSLSLSHFFSLSLSRSLFMYLYVFTVRTDLIHIRINVKCSLNVSVNNTLLHDCINIIHFIKLTSRAIFGNLSNTKHVFLIFVFYHKVSVFGKAVLMLEGYEIDSQHEHMRVRHMMYQLVAHPKLRADISKANFVILPLPIEVYVSIFSTLHNLINVYIKKTYMINNLTLIVVMVLVAEAVFSYYIIDQ